MEMYLDGLDCPACAEKIRCAAEKHKAVKSAEMNFITRMLTVSLHENSSEEQVFSELSEIIKKVEPDVTPTASGKAGEKSNGKMVLVLNGLDCASCAEKIASTVGKLNGVSKADVNFTTKKLTLALDGSIKPENIRTELTGIIHVLEPDVKITDEKNAAPVRDDSGISKMMLVRLAVSAAIFIAGMLLRNTRYELWLFLAGYAVIGTEIVIRAVTNIFKGHPFDECFLMTVATVGAFCVGEYPEGMAVMFLYQLGETLQGYAVGRSRKSIGELMNIRPDSAFVKRDGAISECAPEEVGIGETIVVKAGEKVPLDAVVISGSASVDTSALTGESVPRHVEEGNEILSGCINMNGVIEARVTKEFGQSTASKILELVESSAAKKAKTEKFITRFSKVYTPCVCAAALLIAVVPMLVGGGYSSEWLYRALSFLVVSCPCALVISVPLSFFGGIGGASRKGILVKGGNTLESLAQCKTVVFDKTGTLTNGTFEVTQLAPSDISENELLHYAACAEKNSNHPAAASIMRRCKDISDIPECVSSEEISGRGMKVSTSDGDVILAGNMRLMNENNIDGCTETNGEGTIVHISKNGVYSGFIRISDSIKPDSAAAIARLKEAGVRTVMLTGDRKEAAEAAAKALGIDEYRYELLPADKVSCLEDIMKNSSVTAFVGEGINDAPVLMRADIGIAMGGIGSDAAIEAADAVIMTDEISKIAEAMKISRRTKAIVNQNIVFALGVKAAILLLTAFGLTGMWIAVFGDVGVALLAVLNAMRARKVK